MEIKCLVYTMHLESPKLPGGNPGRTRIKTVPKTMSSKRNLEPHKCSLSRQKPTQPGIKQAIIEGMLCAQNSLNIAYQRV